MIRFATLILCVTPALAAAEEQRVFRDASGMWFLCSETICGYGRSRAEATAHLRQLSKTKSAARLDPEVEKAERFTRDRKIDRKLEDLESRTTDLENNKR